MALTLEQATDELRKKTIREIQADTAITWCHRAVAAMNLGSEHDATEYAHEAIEHAALCGDGQLLRWVQRTVADNGIRI